MTDVEIHTHTNHTANITNEHQNTNTLHTSEQTTIAQVQTHHLI